MLYISQCSGGRLCSFSPCIEQVQRTCQQLRDCHFTGEGTFTVPCVWFHSSTSLLDIEVMESLQRTFGVRERTLSVPHIGVANTPTPHKLTHPTQSQVTLYTAQPQKTLPGHTGYLTFATLPPHFPPSPQPLEPLEPLCPLRPSQRTKLEPSSEDAACTSV